MLARRCKVAHTLAIIERGGGESESVERLARFSPTLLEFIVGPLIARWLPSRAGEALRLRRNS
jgi:hypothetical protein